jgi:hypothetical protein
VHRYTFYDRPNHAGCFNFTLPLFDFLYGPYLAVRYMMQSGDNTGTPGLSYVR